MIGLMKLSIIHIIAAVNNVDTDAFLVIATQPTDSPYVVFGQIPKTVPTIEPTPSPRSVLLSPGSPSTRSRFIIEERFLWSAICSAKTTSATGINAIATSPNPAALSKKYVLPTSVLPFAISFIASINAKSGYVKNA